MAIIEELMTKSQDITEEILSLQKLPLSASWWDEVYLLDGSVPVPSPEVICTLCLCLLNDQDLEELMTGPCDQDVKERLSKLVNEMPLIDVKTIAFEFCRLEKILGYEYKSHDMGSRIALWVILIEDYREPKTASHRLVAKRGINALLNVALFQNDVKMVSALSPAFEEALFKNNPRNKNVNRVIGSILYYYPYLKRKLNRDPTKEEIKNFILHVEPGTPEEPRAWSAGHKLLGIYSSKPKERTVIPDHPRVIGIAQEYLADPIAL